MDIRKLLKHDRQLGGIEVALLVVAILSLIGIGLFALNKGKSKESSINNYQECVDAGYPIMESYPEQCSANGQTFANTNNRAR